MPLPELLNWDNTRIALHQAAQVLGAIRKQAAPRQPLALHLTLRVTPAGVTTGPLDFGGELALDYGRAALIYRQDGDEVGQTALDGRSQAALADAALDLLRPAGVRLELPAIDFKTELAPPVDQEQAAAFAQAQYRLYTALARFRAGLFGALSPLALWSHNFDTAFLLLANPDMTDEHLHAGFGFEPFTPDLPRPYVYAYIRPTPAGLAGAPLPPPARWHTTGWTGVVIGYDELAGQADPEHTLETALAGVWNVFRPFLASGLPG